MKTIKDELQNIILGDEQIGGVSQIRKAQTFLRVYAQTSRSSKEQQHFKDEETAAIVAFATTEKLFLQSSH